MLAFIYRESNDKVVITSLDGEADTRDLALPEVPSQNQYDILNTLSTLPLNTGVIVDAEFGEDTIFNMVDLNSFVVPGAEATVEEKVKDPDFLNTLATVGTALLQEMMDEPRILH
jgi:hypothetical protein